MSTSFVLNGKNVTFDADPTTPLLWAIREDAGLHGTKFGCGMAQCGACTVHLEGEATRSCVLPLAAIAGKRITTIEGIEKHNWGTPCLASRFKNTVQARAPARERSDDRSSAVARPTLQV